MNRYRFTRYLFSLLCTLALVAMLVQPVSAAPVLSFAAEVTYPVGFNPYSVATGDLNHDGYIDLVTANFDGDNVSVLLGNGNGTFAAVGNYFVGMGPRSVVIGDLNRDGNLDLAVANFYTNDVSVLLGNGNGTFAAAVSYFVGTGPISVVTSDLNRDGKLDLAVANNGSNNVSVLLGNGDGTFAGAVNYATGTGPISVVTGDLNRDGILDLAVANYSSGNVSVLLGNGDGTFAGMVNYAAGAYPNSVTAGDLNRDGILDLAVVNYSNGSVNVLLGNGDGSFSLQPSYAVGTYPVFVTAGDLNRDGKLDLITSSNTWSDNLSVLLGNGNGTFAAAVNYTLSSPAWCVTAVDLDHDGKLDLVTANNIGNSVSVLLNTSIIDPAGNFDAAVNYGTGTGTISVTTGDLNRDGILDLVTANGSGNVSVLLGSGSGTFGAAANYAAGLSPYSVTIGDLNRDGKLDLAVANNGSNNVSVLLGNGDGTFAAAVNYAAGTGPISVVTGDLNRDGKLDLVSANYSSSNVSVLLGNGDGTFAAAVNSAAGTYPYSVTAGDLNSDGKLDLAVANFGSNNVSVLLGNGDGTFAAAVNYAAGSGPVCVTAGDLNGDGILDLAMANFNSNSVSVLLGNGDGTFAAAVNYAAGSAVQSVTSGDMDRDGDLDLVTANAAGNNVSVLLGNGDGTFSAGGVYAVDTQPRSVTTADLDRDGDLDLVTTNFSAANVSVLLNVFSKIEVQGNGIEIVNGDATPSTSDGTDFGSVPAAGGTVTHNFIIFSTGTGNLTVSSITFGGTNPGDFSLSGITFPTVIAAGGNTTFQVTFNPSASGTRSAILNIVSNDCHSNLYDFTIQGTGSNSAPVLAPVGNKSVDEGNLLAFTATATDPDVEQTLTFSLDAGAPAGASITTGGAFTWTPTEAQGPGVYTTTVRVTDNGTPALDDFETFNITVNEVNVSPVLAPIGNQTVDEGNLLAFTATATDADLPANTLTFSLDAGAPSGASITSGGAFTWTPTEAQGPGVYTTTVRVTDNGTPALDDFETFNITVHEVNVAPVLAPIGNQTVDELTLLSFTATATDADLPPNTLTFSLDAGAPAGASITTGGAFTWTPTEAQGPGVYTTTVRVTDNGTPALDDFETFNITVNEVNVAPVLAPIGNKTVNELTLLSFTATATDADLPPNTLTFSLDAGAPAGASITTSGAFTWTPTEAQGPGVYPVTVRVNDNGTPALSDFETINITVNEVNVAPVAAADTYTTTENTVLDVAAPGLLSNDSDADLPPQTLTAVLDTPPAQGELALAADGSFVYTPTLNFNGTVTFTYFANDGVVNSNAALVSIIVTSVNHAPVPNAGADVNAVEGDLIQFHGSYTDPGMNVLAVTIAWDFGDGTTATGSLTPTHAYADNGIYTVTLTVNDGEGGVGSDTLLATITNAAPELAPIPDRSVNVGDLFTVTVAFTDPGLLDTHSALIDWGNGLTETVNLAAGLTGFRFSGSYNTAGVYTVTVTLTDKDGGVDVETFTVTAIKNLYRLVLPIIRKDHVLP